MNGENLRLIRDYLDFTQEEMAEYLNVSLGTIGKIERNHMSMSDTMIAKITHKFDVTSKDFADYCEQQEKVKQYFNS